MRVYITIVLCFEILSVIAAASRDKDWKKESMVPINIAALVGALVIVVLAIIFTWKI